MIPNGEVTRLERLVALRDRLETAIDECESMRDLAALSRQYRETLREIEELDGGNRSVDEIGEILAMRDAHGEPGAVRPNRTAVPED